MSAKQGYSNELELSDITTDTDRNKSRNVVIIRESQPSLIGHVKCYWYNKDGVPRITIGPTWAFSVPVFMVVCVMLYCYITGLGALDSSYFIYKIIAAIIIIANLYCFFYTLFGN
jgi:hypothetical protein